MMFLQKLISEVKVQVENQVKGIYVNITAICPDGTRRPGAEGCGNVTSNDEVCGCAWLPFQVNYVVWHVFSQKIKPF